MAYPPHLKLSFIGEFRNHASGVKVEEFTFTTSWADLGWDVASKLPNDATMEAKMDALASAASTWWSSGLDMPSNVHLTEIKLAPIGADGKYPPTSQSHYRVIDQAGSTSPSPYPSELALCVSIGTGGRGAHRRGRFYIPTDCTISDFVFSDSELGSIADHVYPAFMGADAASIAGVMKTLDGASDIVLGVASSTGVFYAATQLRFGHVPDVISRRRNKMVENYLVRP